MLFPTQVEKEYVKYVIYINCEKLCLFILWLTTPPPELPYIYRFPSGGLKLWWEIKIDKK